MGLELLWTREHYSYNFKGSLRTMGRWHWELPNYWGTLKVFWDQWYCSLDQGEMKPKSGWAPLMAATFMGSWASSVMLQHIWMSLCTVTIHNHVWSYIEPGISKNLCRQIVTNHDNIRDDIQMSHSDISPFLKFMRVNENRVSYRALYLMDIISKHHFAVVFNAHK